MNTPVLLIAFNRPDHTKRVLEAILAAKPQDLYVFQDGARDGNMYDEKNCTDVRGVIMELTEGIPVRLHTFFSDKNLGCGPGPASALNWFFENEEMGIILEDDAIPHPDFFPYCEELLCRYKEDESIRAIGSMKVMQEKKYGDGSYYFSMMNRNLCAWATWRRAWQSFDLSLTNVRRKDLDKALSKYGCGLLERNYWCERLDDVHENLCDGKSWDMQFFMSIWLNHGKGIIPNVNLSSNIGTVGEATHRMKTGNIIDNLPSYPIMPVSHPSSKAIQHEADRQFHFLYFEPEKKNWNCFRIAYKIFNKRVKRLVGHKGPWLNKRREK